MKNPVPSITNLAFYPQVDEVVFSCIIEIMGEIMGYGEI